MISTLGPLRRVQHLNCCSFRPWPGALLATHVVLCEFEHGLVLIDSALGVTDSCSPARQLGVTTKLLRPSLNVDETAVFQISKLGFSPRDVSHIVATHLDYDHIGGAADFPAATVHATSAELASAVDRNSIKRRTRYRAPHLGSIAHRIVHYDGPGEADVLGLTGHQLDTEGALFLLPLSGHTVGHAAVAIRDPARGWLIHAGDAFLHRAAIGLTPADVHSRIAGFAERRLAMEGPKLAPNHRILGDLAAAGHRVFCSHDLAQFTTLREESDRNGRIIQTGTNGSPKPRPKGHGT